jgi:hypothetical protein
VRHTLVALQTFDIPEYKIPIQQQLKFYDQLFKMSDKSIFIYGTIRPLECRHLKFDTRPLKVNEYGAMDVDTLVSEAKQNNTDFELFIELHRRAARNFEEKRGQRYDWDCIVIGPGYGVVETVKAQKERCGLLKEYDRQ